MSTTDRRSTRDAPSAPIRCARCNRPLESPVYCGNCRRLQPADGVDHFALLGVPDTYDLDDAALRRAYFELSRRVHPDRLAAVSPDESRLALRISARANEAYQTLGDPLLRAEYLLERCGGATASQDKTVPQEVLGETLMIREEIDEARSAGDEATLAALREQVTRSFAQRRDEIAGLARQLPGDDDLRRRLRHALNTIRYYQRMLEQFHES